MVRRLRLFSGLVLMAYVTTHLLNHALGLISLEVLEAGRIWFLAVWRSWIGTLLLYGALFGHVLLVLWALFERRTLKLRPAEGLQIVLGFAIPLFLMTHFIGTRGAQLMFGMQDSYTLILLIQWKLDPSYIGYQTAGLLATWIHGCLGLHLWFRLKRWYAGAYPYIYASYLIVPLLALLGFAEAGKDVVALADSDVWLRRQLVANGFPTAAELREIIVISESSKWVLAGAVVLIMIARWIRAFIESRRGTVRITYPDGRIVASPPGSTILEISQRSGIPHASVCGGRGRCSTCRVRLLAGWERLPEPSAEEQRVLERIGRPIHVRLACQARPTGDLAIVPLLPPDAELRESHRVVSNLQGEEREVAILFADLRSFTKFSEQKLPYDVVFVLNRYFANMGQAVEDAGGHLDKFIGDGVMALFGIEGSYEAGCRGAIEAARAMAERLAQLNTSLANDLDEPLRIGIGIHAGPAIVGEMGYGTARGITAIGDAVNTASRLETATKEFGVQLVVSEAVATTAKFDLSRYPSHQISLRGRSETVAARVIERADLLPKSS